MGSLLYHDGKPYAIQGIARDITDRKKAEKELKEANSQILFLNLNWYILIQNSTILIQIIALDIYPK